MKSIIIIVVLGFITIQHVNAQTDSVLTLPKHEISVSYGFLPIVYTMPVVNEFTLAWLNFNYSYMYNINSKHSIGTTISFSFSTYEPKDTESRNISISQQLQYKYVYRRKRNTNIYFYMGAGVLIQDSEDNNPYQFFTGRFYWLSYQVDFFGISFGKKHHKGFVELGWGNQGTLKAGYSYKF